MNRKTFFIWAVCVLALLTLLISSLFLVEKEAVPLAKIEVQSNVAAKTQAKVIHEDALNTVQLSAESYRKLGIEIAQLKQTQIIANKSYGAELVVPTGEKIAISAPITGKLIRVKKTPLISGVQVKAGDVLYLIQPLLTADARANMLNALADTESLVNTTSAQVEGAHIALNRAQKLLQDLVGSQRNVDESNANYQVALTNLQAAKNKRDVLHQVVNIGTVAPIEIRAPQAGIISNIVAVADQLVSSGNPIIEIAQLNKLWVRVPIPAADLDNIDLHASAQLAKLSSSTNAKPIAIQPINAPPTADALTGTVHIYYELPNTGFAFNPAQRVSVSVPAISHQQHAITAPWSAVVFDIFGGSWVYVQTSATEYKRERVFVASVQNAGVQANSVQGAIAVLHDGPPAGTKIVANGALELFGLETGFAH